LREKVAINGGGVMKRELSSCLAILALGAFAGCGGSGGHPDTGYGANQPVPTTLNCVDLCVRSTACGVELCDEDTNSTRYNVLQPALQSECEGACTDAQLQVSISSAQWQCVFQDSCRQVFGDDACGGMGRYTCN
jgi:hypothetical protein